MPDWHRLEVTAVANMMSLKRLHDRLRAFGADRRGNVMLTFVLALLPMVGLVGAGIDYSRAASTRTGMQMALDATALAMAKDMSNGGNPALLQQSTQNYFVALFNRPDMQDIQITATPDVVDGTSILFTASARIKTEFMRVMGFDSLPISATSTAAWGHTKLQVALVLDNTLSMYESDKIGALKIASHRLLKILKDAAKNPQDVQVAVIPFANEVNVSKTNLTASWIDWNLWDALFGVVSMILGKKSRDTWSGCVTDRDGGNNALNTKPSPSDILTLFPASQPLLGCPIALMPLTTDWTALNNMIDTMQPVGTTNQTIGLAWGWQAMTQGPPLNAPGKSPDVRQVIVMLTDGLNTQDRWTNIFMGGNVADMDARTKKVCDNIKAADIQIYTVLVMSGNSSILQNCASKPDMYFALTRPDQMVDTFQQIGTNITNLRIAQ
jgi:Flp pilus assembly protein TadG